MIESELKNLWNSISDFELISFEKDLLDKEIRNQVKSFDRRILIRDILETSLAFLLILIGCFIAYIITNTFIKIGALLMIPSCLLIIYMILKTRKMKQPNESSSSNSEFLQKTLIYYKAQKKLLNTVLFWYILPPAICTVFILIGLDMPKLKFWYAILVTGGLGYFIYRINQITVTKKIEPLIKMIEEEIDELAK